jgi:hypothetical protein
MDAYCFCLRLQGSEKRAVNAIMGMLESSIKPWHCAASELIGRLIINPDNESFLHPAIPQVNVLFGRAAFPFCRIFCYSVMLLRWI